MVSHRSLQCYNPFTAHIYKCVCLCVCVSVCMCAFERVCMCFIETADVQAFSLRNLASEELSSAETRVTWTVISFIVHWVPLHQVYMQACAVRTPAPHPSLMSPFLHSLCPTPGNHDHRHLSHWVFWGHSKDMAHGTDSTDLTVLITILLHNGCCRFYHHQAYTRIMRENSGRSI